MKTDRILKDQLNGNQPHRERMCLELLAMENGYTDVQPRLPKGGPDGGRDIQCSYQGLLCFGAVGFVNDANDGVQHRSQVETKFKGDLASGLKNAVEESLDLKAFVFFTNVGLTPTILKGLIDHAKGEGIEHCVVYDRERLAPMLDSPTGYAIRFTYLGIKLKGAEQFDVFNALNRKIDALSEQVAKQKKPFLPKPEWSKDTAAYLIMGWEDLDGSWMIRRSPRLGERIVDEDATGLLNEGVSFDEAWKNFDVLNYAVKGRRVR